MEIFQERPTPIAFVKICTGNNSKMINREIQQAMNEALEDDYWLVRAKTELVFSPQGHTRWTTQLEFAEKVPEL